MPSNCYGEINNMLKPWKGFLIVIRSKKFYMRGKVANQPFDYIAGRFSFRTWGMSESGFGGAFYLKAQFCVIINV